MTLSDLERRHAKCPFLHRKIGLLASRLSTSSSGPLLGAYRLTNSDQVWHGNPCGRGVNLGVSHASYPKGRKHSATKFFWTPTYSYSVWPRTMNFSVSTYMGRGLVRGQPRLNLRDGATVLRNFWDPTNAHTVWHRTTKFDVVAHGVGRVFTGSATPLHISGMYGAVYQRQLSFLFL